MLRAKLLSIILLLSSAVAFASPAVDEIAPDFKLPDQIGKMHSLKDYAGQWVVLYFYPKDDTPGCTTQACEFRDNIFAYRRLNAQVLGVSFDDVDSKKEFAEEYNLPFPILADVDGSAIDAYGVRSSMPLMKMSKRQTFIISPDGKVAKHYENVDVDTHSADVIAALEALSADS